MPSAHPDEILKSSDMPSIFLEIDAEDTPIRAPVLIKNLTDDLVTVEVESPWYLVFWAYEDLLGRGGDLRLTRQGDGETVNIRGQVAWARYLGEKKRQLALGLKLARPNQAIIKLLKNSMAHTPKDLKGLWDRWDQDHKRQQDSLVDRKVYLAALVLMVAGLLLQLPGLQSFKLLGWILWLLGGLGVAGRGLWSLWPRRASR